MTIQQCKYIVEVAKHNSISKAASTMYISQPSISKAIRDVESEFGIKVLERSNKGVYFTEDGSELLFYAKILLEQVDALDYRFKTKHKRNCSKISISSQHFGFVIKAVSELMESLNSCEYSLTIREGKAIDVIEDVNMGKSLLGVLSISNLNKDYFQRYFISKELIFTSLYTMKQHVFLRKEHPLACRKSLNLSELENYPFLTFHQEDILLYFAEELVQTNQIPKVVYLNDRGTMNNLLSNTDGYNLGTGCIVENYMNTNIISIPLEGHNDINVGLIKRYDQIMPKEVESFIDLVNTCLLSTAPKNN